MPNVATWIRQKDEKWFAPFFVRQPTLSIRNARTETVDMGDVAGLLLTGGSDIAAEFLRQDVPDPSVVEEPDLARDRWEFDAVEKAIAQGIPIFAICRGMQVINVALGGTLKLDIPGHRAPEMKDNDVQTLRNDCAATHRFERVNSSHHQAVDSLADKFVVEAWSAEDEIVEQMRLLNYPFALAVQYHPERGTIYDALFEDFFAHVRAAAGLNG